MKSHQNCAFCGKRLALFIPSSILKYEFPTVGLVADSVLLVHQRMEKRENPNTSVVLAVSYCDSSTTVSICTACENDVAGVKRRYIEIHIPMLGSDWMGIST